MRFSEDERPVERVLIDLKVLLAPEMRALAVIQRSVDQTSE